MLDHIGFPVTDFARAKAFYTGARAAWFALLMERQLVRRAGPGGYAGFGAHDRPHFWIGTGKPSQDGLHVAFAAKIRA